MSRAQSKLKKMFFSFFFNFFSESPDPHRTDLFVRCPRKCQIKFCQIIYIIEYTITMHCFGWAACFQVSPLQFIFFLFLHKWHFFRLAILLLLSGKSLYISISASRIGFSIQRYCDISSSSEVSSWSCFAIYSLGYI